MCRVGTCAAADRRCALSCASASRGWRETSRQNGRCLDPTQGVPLGDRMRRATRTMPSGLGGGCDGASVDVWCGRSGGWIGRVGPSRRRHLRVEQVRDVHGHADPDRVHQPALLAVLRGEGSRRQGVEAPMRDAVGARAAPLGVDQGAFPRRPADHRRGRARSRWIRRRAISTPFASPTAATWTATGST